MNNINIFKMKNIALITCFTAAIFTFLFVGSLFTNPKLSDASTFLGANGKIVFQSNRDSNYEIYTINADGSEQSRLTNTAAADSDPAWSPDGTKIVFSSNRHGGNMSIYLMNADGSDQKRITTNFDTTPSWSPDGKKIVFSSYRDGQPNSEIYVMNADGSDQTRITNNSVIDYDPTWSPDGTKIAFVRAVFGGQSQIFLMNDDGTGQTQLSPSDGRMVSSPNWSPDGVTVAYGGGFGGGVASDVYVINANGSGRTNLTPSTPVDDTNPSWSPDGTKIAFMSGRGTSPPNGEIYMMSNTGGDIIRLTNNTSEDGGPDWQSTPIQATFELKPDTLNLKSTGKFVSGYIELPQNIDVNDIKVDSVKLQETIQADSSPPVIGDFDADGNPDAMFKFDRKSLEEKLSTGDSVKVKITGMLKDNSRFEGEDTIRVIKPGVIIQILDFFKRIIS